ncbi:MAG: leucine-rich repeat protein [Clostridia bacterium]
MRKFVLYGCLLFSVIVAVLAGIFFSKTIATTNGNVVVSFYSDGQIVMARHLTKGEELAMLPVSAKEGYEFIGWYMTNDSLNHKVTEKTSFDNSTMVIAVFSKIINKNNEPINVSLISKDEKSITIKGGTALSQEEQQSLSSLNVLRYDFSGVQLENNKLGDNVFKNKKVEEVVLPLSAREIGENAFYQSSSLCKLNTEFIETIGSRAFFNCTKMRSLNLSGLLSLKDNVFTGCSIRKIEAPKLTNFTFKSFENSRIESIDVNNANYISEDGVVLDVSGKTIIVVPPCKSENYIVPASVKTINEYSFYNSMLTNITIPNSVTNIERYAFYNACAQNISLSEALLVINEYTFAKCGSLRKINISTNVREIKQYAFAECSSLRDVVIEYSGAYGVDKVYEHAFYKCSSLSKMEFGSSLKEIGEYTFAENTSLSLFRAESITKIPNNAFDKNSSLKVLSVGKITTIGNSAFSYAANIPSFDFSETTSIGAYAFRGNNEIINIDLPKILDIGEFAFTDNLKLNSVILGEQLKSIGNSAFSGCSAIASVNIKALSVPTIAENSAVFGILGMDFNKSIQIFVKNKDNYLADINWVYYKDYLYQ